MAKAKCHLSLCIDSCTCIEHSTAYDLDRKRTGGTFSDDPYALVAGRSGSSADCGIRDAP